ncbi:866_t:CDS:2, partial [Racocetra persica]
KVNKNQSKRISSSSCNMSNEDTLSKVIAGIKYHNVKNSTYFLPSDNEEADRLHLQHYILKNVWQSNFFAPVEHLLRHEGAKVLDIGTGAGSWLYEMVTDYPNAKFTGIDISPVHSNHTKPSNAEVINGNVLERLAFDDNTFDYVFQRVLYSGIPENKWPSVINELVRVLKPNGYLEADFKPDNMGPATTKITDGLSMLFHEHGLDPHVCYKLQNLLEEQGQLHDIHCEIKKKIDTKDAVELQKLETYRTLKPKLANVMKVRDGHAENDRPLPSLMKVSNDEYDDLANKMDDELSKLKYVNTQCLWRVAGALTILGQIRYKT